MAAILVEHAFELCSTESANRRLTDTCAAARQQLAAFLGVYDRFFRLPGTWRLAGATAPASPLTWRAETGDVLVDVVRTAPPSHPLVDAGTLARVAAVAAWAEDRSARLVGVRLLAVSAPGTSLLRDSAGGFVPLTDTSFAGGLPLPTRGVR